MTGYTVHTGSSENFAEGWDRVFGGAKKKSSASQPSEQEAPKQKNSRSSAPGKRARKKHK